MPRLHFGLVWDVSSLTARSINLGVLGEVESRIYGSLEPRRKMTTHAALL